jgi:hypothetical protein
MATHTDNVMLFNASKGTLDKIGDTETLEIHGLELTSSLSVPESGLSIGSTAVTATASELNKLDGVTASTTQINYVNVTTLGTAEASKAITVDGSSQVDASAITFTNLGTVTTADINGGTIDGVVIGGSSAASGTFTSLDCTDGAFSINNLDIDGGTDIGADLVDSDLIIIDDGAAGVNRKSALSRLKTYIQTSSLSFTGSNTFENSSGQTFQGGEAGAGTLYLKADQGDDAGDSWEISVADGGVLTFSNDIALKNTFVSHVTLTPNATASNSAALFAGNVTVNGNLTVNGDTTTLSTSTLTVEDINIVVANGAANSAAADGAGITIDGANATLTWVNANSHLAFNKDVNFLTSGIKINGTAVTATAAELNKLDGVTATTAEINTLSGLTASTSELNLLDATAGSSLTLAAGDGLIINDASDGNAAKKVLLSDLTSFFSSSGSTTADNITAGSSAVEITTTSGDVVIDAPSGQSVDLQVNGGNIVEVASDRVSVSQPLIVTAAGLSLAPAAAHPAFVAGNILAFESGASGGLELADCDDSVNTYLNAPFGVALESSAQDNTSEILVHTIHGGLVNVKLASSTTAKGQWVYLDTTAGQATVSVPTSGMVWRLGLCAEHNGSAVTDADIVWMPQFIADLG